MSKHDRISTAAALLEAADFGPCELIEGRLIRRPYTDFRIGRIIGRLITRLGDDTSSGRLGVVTSSGAGYFIRSDPDTVYCFSAAFVRTDRLAYSTDGYFPGAPDLFVEFLSPTNSQRQIAEKIADCLDAGATASWVIDPDARNAVMHRRDRDPIHLPSGGVLTDEELLPGFSLRLAELFEGI